MLLEQKLDQYTPSPYLTFSIHLDGNRDRHDHAVDRPGTFDKAVSAIKAARARGFRVTANCTLYAGEDPEDVANFFDYAMTLGVEGVMMSPGYSYQHAPRQDVFLGRRKSKELFRDIFKAGKKRGSKWHFNQSSLFIDFLAGNQSYQCTPWANPTYNVFGWQKPCYLLVDEGYATSFKELMETTEWEKYGVGRNPKCDNCMAHCGYEGTAVEHTISSPLTALNVFLFGPRLDGEMAPELPVLHSGQAPGVTIRVDQIGGRTRKD